MLPEEILFILLLLLSIVCDAQSRKEQIEIQKFKIDSLNSLLFEYEFIISSIGFKVKICCKVYL